MRNGRGRASFGNDLLRVDCRLYRVDFSWGHWHHAISQVRRSLAENNIGSCDHSLRIDYCVRRDRPGHTWGIA